MSGPASRELRIAPGEGHLTGRINWLRAAVLGANDGIVSTASLVVGIAAADATRESILLVNASAGDEAFRVVSVARRAPIDVFVLSPSSLAEAPFAIYAWPGEPGPDDLRVLPAGIGASVST